MVMVCCAVAAAADSPAPTVPATPSATAPAQPAPDQVQSVAEPPKSAPAAPLPEQVEAKTLDEVRPGVIVHSKLPDGRPFSLYVPKAYDKSRPWPLLVELTARGVGRDNILWAWQAAEDSGTILVAPDTYTIFGKPDAQAKVTSTKPAWSRSNGEVEVPITTRSWEEYLKDLRGDAEAIAATVDLVKKSLAVEKELVVLTGYSGAAWVAYYTGCSDPGRYAGVCIRSGIFESRLMPASVAKAANLPITVVLGEKDMQSVLEDTARAEEYFQRMKFTNFQVERLPNSGHDSRPEAAGNFVRLLEQNLKARRLAEARKQWDGYFKAGRSALTRGEMDKARQWLQKAAEMEKALPGLPQEATILLARLSQLPAGAAVQPKQESAP